MKIIITIILILLSAGCAFQQATNVDNQIVTDNLLNGHGWQTMNLNEKICYIKGYMEGLGTGAYLFMKNQLPDQEKAVMTFSHNVDIGLETFKVNDVIDQITKSYLKYPMSKAEPVNGLLCIMIFEALKNKK